MFFVLFIVVPQLVMIQSARKKTKTKNQAAAADLFLLISR